mgnify:CR=1 FL=1
MSVFQNAKDHKNPPSRLPDIRISIKLVHFIFDFVFLNVPFVFPYLCQLENCSLECQFSNAQIHI